MCVSPLIRYRAKRQDAGTFLASCTQWMIKSAKELESYFKSYSAFRAYMDIYMDYQYIPCRKCVECRAKYARDWSIRCYHEFMINPVGAFITLTVDSSKVHLFFQSKKLKTYCRRCVKGNRFINYPIDYTLCKGFILDEIKRIRDVLFKRYNVKIRYFGVGEYGENNERPHYHILIFGYDFPDKLFFKKSSKGVDIFLSEELSELWQYGIATVQQINHQACMYTAKYCCKKLQFNSEQAELETYYGREQEFIFMSKGNCQSNRCPYINEIIKNCKGLNSLRNLDNPYCKYCDKTRGGIGYNWLLKYIQDVVKIGYCTIDGIKYPLPKYYLDILKLTDKEKYDMYKINQAKFVDDRNETNPELLSSDRLNAKKEVIKNRLKHYHRQ